MHGPSEKSPEESQKAKKKNSAGGKFSEAIYSLCVHEHWDKHSSSHLKPQPDLLIPATQEARDQRRPRLFKGLEEMSC